MATATQNQPRMNAEQLFDSIGPAYEIAFEGLPTQAAAIDWCIAELEKSNTKPAKCLDIGCGTGVPTCSRLADAGHDVLGIDVSGVMIKDAEKKVSNARFQKVDMLDFQPEGGDGSYDCVTVFFSMIASLTQDQIRENIRSIYRWLKSGGIFVFATVPVAGNNLDIMWMDRSITVSSLNPEDAVQTISSAGFEVVQKAQTNFLPKAGEAGICEQEQVWEEPHLFMYARKK